MEKHKHMTSESFREEDFMDLEGIHPWNVLEDVNVENGMDDICTSVEEWQMAVTFNLTADNWDEIQKRNATFFIKLANTPPERLPGWRQDKKILDLNQFTLAWIGVYNTLGRTWPDGIRWNNDELSTTSTATKHPLRIKKKQKTGTSGEKKEDSITIAKRSVKSQKIDWFVERDNEGQEVYILDETWNMNNRIKDFLEFLEAFWEADPSACIPTWYRKIKKEPLHKETPQLIDREFVKPYVAFFYTSSAKGGSYIRLKIRHSTDIGTILDHPSIRYQADKKHVYLYEDKIQAVTVTQAGWFAGSINSRNGIRDLESILKNHPFAQFNKVDNLELRVSQVIIDPNDRKAPEGERVFALHAYTDFKSTGAVRELLQMIYPADPQTDYPMGRQMRFVPNVADSRFIRPPEAKSKARQLRDRQQTFLWSLRSTQTKDILKLNRAIKTPPYPSLMKVLTSWMSTRYPDEKLFVAIEEDIEAVTFHYLEKNEEQAETIIPLLGIVLENEFGREIWEWFTYSARTSCSSYKYSKDNKMVVNKEATPVGKEWNLGIRSNVAGIKVSSSFKIDVGDIQIGQEGGRPLDDQSIATMGFRKGPGETLKAVEVLQENDDESTLSASVVTRKDDTGWKTDNDTITEDETKKTQDEKVVDIVPMEVETNKSDKTMENSTNRKNGEGSKETEKEDSSKDDDTQSMKSMEEDISIVTRKRKEKSEQTSTDEKGRLNQRAADDKDDDDSVSLVPRRKPKENKEKTQRTGSQGRDFEGSGQDDDMEQGSDVSSDDNLVSLVSKKRKKKQDMKTQGQKEQILDKSTASQKSEQEENEKKGSIWDKRRAKAKERNSNTAIVSPIGAKKSKEETSGRDMTEQKQDEEDDSQDDNLPLIEWARKYNKSKQNPIQNEIDDRKNKSRNKGTENHEQE